MKILITGASGFIGRNLVEFYSSRFMVDAPSRSDLDLLDANAVSTYLRQRHFDLVIHSATCRSSRRLGADTPDLLHRNCQMFFNLARNSESYGRMLSLSSGAVYDRAHWHALMREDHLGRHIPSDNYGLSKYICAKAVDEFDRVYELRLFGVFGPYEDWQVRFISNACCRAAWGLPVLVRQNVVFDYLAVDDLARILEMLGSTTLCYKSYNVCTGNPVDLISLGADVVRASGKDLPIKLLHQGLGNEYSGCNARLLSAIPGFTFRDRHESIVELYRWYVQRKMSIDPGLLHFDE